MNPNLNYIGSNVRRFRKNRKWTQEEMARRANISRIALIHIESGKAVPTLDTLASLANVLEIPMTSLLSRPVAHTGDSAAALLADPGEVDAIDYELKNIMDKLRSCNLNQVVTLRKVIDTVLLGYQDRPAAAAE
ncbi:MAG: helix-turn-helix transcriptional regulator [Silvanigrellales bacterium]|jgi:transcriptional regulator with XRE-family HTH domain|nr:helix-turn-helix transcriptional regulator [Silvanigrellales bacterium]